MMRLLFAMLLVMLSTGCSACTALDGAAKDAAAKLDPVDDAVRGVNASGAALVAHHAALTDAQTLAERLTVETSVAAGATEAETRANVAKVRAPFTHAWNAYAGAREAWLKAHAAVSAAVALRAAGKAPDVTHVLAAVAALAAAWDAVELTTPTRSTTK